MRRDMTTSLRACLAAEAWKKLYPKGAPKTGKVRTDYDLTYIDFAKRSFKATRDPAPPILATLPEALTVQLAREMVRLAEKPSAKREAVDIPAKTHGLLLCPRH